MCMCYSLWTLNSVNMALVILFQGQTYSKFFSFNLSTIYRTGKNVSSCPSAHLKQRDQVARVLRTVDFWLIVCRDTRVFTVAAKWAASMLFPVQIHYPPGFICSRFGCAGMNSVWENIFHKPRPPRLPRHINLIGVGQHVTFSYNLKFKYSQHASRWAWRMMMVMRGNQER